MLLWDWDKRNIGRLKWMNATNYFKKVFGSGLEGLFFRTSIHFFPFVSICFVWILSVAYSFISPSVNFSDTLKCVFVCVWFLPICSMCPKEYRKIVRMVFRNWTPLKKKNQQNLSAQFVSINVERIFNKFRYFPYLFLVPIWIEVFPIKSHWFFTVYQDIPLDDLHFLAYSFVMPEPVSTKKNTNKRYDEKKNDTEKRSVFRLSSSPDSYE